MGDAAAVTGNGELVILCGQLTGSGEADPIVRRVRDIMDCPVEVGRVPVRVVSASGVAMASSPQDTAEALVATAGRAMRAQRNPAGRVGVPAWPARVRPAGRMLHPCDGVLILSRGRLPRIARGARITGLVDI